jgi:hypothetical protein
MELAKMQRIVQQQMLLKQIACLNAKGLDRVTKNQK